MTDRVSIVSTFPRISQDSQDTLDDPGISLVKVTDYYSMDLGILESRGTWDYRGMFTALALELIPGSTLLCSSEASSLGSSQDS